MSPSIKQIRYICAVAEYKHFSKAAEACFVTQSTLSAAIQDLESQLGVIIFERSKKSVLITPSGEKLLDSMQYLDETLPHTKGVVKPSGENGRPQYAMGV